MALSRDPQGVDNRFGSSSCHIRATAFELALSRGPSTMGERPQAAVRAMAGALPDQGYLAIRSRDVPHQGPRRQLARRHPRRSRARQLDRPGGRQGSAGRLRHNVAEAQARHSAPHSRALRGSAPTPHPPDARRHRTDVDHAGHAGFHLERTMYVVVHVRTLVMCRP